MKNASKQAWAFKAEATLTNVGDEELQGWKMFVGFQHHEILVSADGAILIDAGDFPADVDNGTTLVGSAVSDLKTAIETAGDLNQMSAKIDIVGTQFGLGPGATPMPKTIHLENDGFKCPTPTRRGNTHMHAFNSLTSWISCKTSDHMLPIYDTYIFCSNPT